jgi:hypothetical protein
MPVYPNNMLEPTYLIGAVNDKPSAEAIKGQYKGLTLFPWEETPERQFIWDVMYSENNLAGVYDERGDAIPGDEMLFSSMIGNLIDIKASRTLDSWTTRALRDAGMPAVYKGAAGGSFLMSSIEAHMKKNINKCIADNNNRIDSQLEYFAMQALQGSVQWPPVDNTGAAIATPMESWNYKMNFNVPFGIPALQNQNVTTLVGYNSAVGGAALWSDHTNANPILDLDVIDEYMAKTKGVTMRGGTILMDSTTLRHLAQCTNVLHWLVGTYYSQPSAPQMADPNEIRTAIKTKLGWNIEVYNAQWTFRGNNPGGKPTVQRVDFLKPGYIVVLPNGSKSVGTMMTTALESEPGGKWLYGKVPWSYQNQKRPYDIQLGIDATAWPRYSSYDHFILRVL